MLGSETLFDLLNRIYVEAISNGAHCKLVVLRTIFPVSSMRTANLYIARESL